MKKTRFLIQKDGVYYLTTGKLLTYDEGAAEGNEQKKKDVEWIKSEFKRIHDAPCTWYRAVQMDDDDISAINTGEA